MTMPRRVTPGRSYLVTRRCSERRFFLVPSDPVNAVMRYALGLSASRHGVEVHAFVANVNHVHIVCSDPRGSLPDFMRELDALVARALNAHYGRSEAFWGATASFSAVEAHDAETLFAQLVYVIVNAVNDGQVRRPELWPGVHTLPEDLDARTIVAQRPQLAFFGGRRPEGWTPTFRRDKKGRVIEDARKGVPLTSTLPEVVELKITIPALLGHVPPDELRARLRQALDARVAQVELERKQAGLPPPRGATAVRKLDPFSSPGNPGPSFKLDPHLACRDPKRRKALLRGLVAWRSAYRAALCLWREGIRAVRFPWGTYALPRFHRALLVPAPS